MIARSHVQTASLVLQTVLMLISVSKLTQEIRKVPKDLMQTFYLKENFSSYDHTIELLYIWQAEGVT